MKKKRSIGIILVSICGLLIAVPKLLIDVWGSVLLLSDGEKLSLAVLTWLPLYSLSVIISSIFLLRLKKWARALFIIQSLLYFLSRLYWILYTYFPQAKTFLIYKLKFFIYSAVLCDMHPFIPDYISLFIPLLLLFYLTRSRVKEQFG